jgi:glycosyltransferase involved in cell wall biosynthesis
LGVAKKMRILWICGSRIVGGSERVTIRLAELLQARGHVIEVLCPSRSALPQVLMKARLPVHQGHIGTSIDVRSLFVIRRALKLLSPDLALVTTAHEWVWTCLAKSSRHRIPVILVRHMMLPLPKLVRRLANKKADAIVVVSEAAREPLLKGGIIRPELVHFIPNPVRFAPRHELPSHSDRVRARGLLGLPQSGRWVGFLGGLDKQKGIEDAARAVGEASTHFGEVHLLVCGRSGQTGGLSTVDLARESGLAGRLHYLGELQDVHAAMTAVDVVMVATHDCLKESSPAVLHEAMACGTPVIAYATGAIPEHIGAANEAGLLATPDDPSHLAARLKELFSDACLAQRLAEVGLSRVKERCSPKLIADRFEQLIKRLVK